MRRLLCAYPRKLKIFSFFLSSMEDNTVTQKTGSFRIASIKTHPDYYLQAFTFFSLSRFGNNDDAADIYMQLTFFCYWI